MSFQRVILLIIDACGIGELPDAAAYDDDGAATIPNVAAAVGGLSLTHLEQLGLGRLADIAGLSSEMEASGAFGRMMEQAPGKDSTTGHWELAGYILPTPLPLFPHGFPDDLVDRFVAETGIPGVLGNETASGTEIIARLGAEHLATRKPILYTSADSVFQLAAHEELYPIPDLYRICRTARLLCSGEFDVGRVIARPFIGEPGSYSRTVNRKDFSRLPPTDTVLDLLVKRNCDVTTIGKVYDLFAGRGVTYSVKAGDNASVLRALHERVENDHDSHLLFANCVDFDQTYGHRNDVRGFAAALELFDESLGELLPKLRPHDLLLITADHGCDPTLTHSTDHTREYVPLLATGKAVRPGVDLGTRTTFADVAKTIADIFFVDHAALPGLSFRRELLGK